ncbi:MAG: DUF1592 domain-containing protein [Myxococcota bacterium]
MAERVTRSCSDAWLSLGPAERIKVWRDIGCADRAQYGRLGNAMRRFTIPLMLAMGCDPEPPVSDGFEDDAEVVPDQAGVFNARHRLGRDEIEQTIHAVFDVPSEVVSSMPLEPDEGGFRNAATALEVSTLLTDKLAAASLEVARAYLEGQQLSQPLERFTLQAEYFGWSDGYRGASPFIVPMGSPYWAWFGDGVHTTALEIPESGTWTLELNMSRPAQWNTPEAVVEVTLDGDALVTVVVQDGPSAPLLTEVSRTLTAGTHELAFQVVEGWGWPPPEGDFLPEQPPVPAVALDAIHVSGPLERAELGLAERWACETPETTPLDCAEAFLAPLAARAWRRPISDDELDATVALVQLALDEGLTLEDGLMYGIRRIVMSPHFLFKLELHDVAEDGAGQGEAHDAELAPYELASRLAYFLWASPPDDALTDCAESGELLRNDGPCAMGAQVRRMLDDERAHALADSWAYQWLGLRQNEDIFKVWEMFPGFTLPLSEAMTEETVHVVDHAVHADLPLTDLVVADWTYLNNELAEYYGVSLPGSDQLTRVSISTDQRVGIVTHGSLMAGTSLEHRTSPVKRAIWLLDTFLCTQVGAPPPFVPQLQEEMALEEGFEATLDAHNDPSCRACHDQLDPLGLALENYDPAGGWRDTLRNGTPIEVDTVTIDGTVLQHPSDVGAWIHGHEAFPMCLSSKLASYGVGVSSLHSRAPDTVAAIQSEAEAGGMTAASMIQAVTEHPVFHHGEVE